VLGCSMRYNNNKTGNDAGFVVYGETEMPDRCCVTVSRI
jgi:hypothetical protein